MKRLVQRIIRLRNPEFRFDDALNNGALFQFMVLQVLALLRGCRLLFFLKNPKGALLGKGVSFFNASRITYGKFMKLGDYVYISAMARSGVFMGNSVGIGAFSRIVVSTSLHQVGSFIRIGNNVGIGEFAYLGGAGGLEIGDDTIVGQYFSCHPENHLCDHADDLIRRQGVTREGIRIGSNCWIGSKVTVLDGVTIGNGCVVAAGAVVTKSFPENCVIGGVPARRLKGRIKDA